MNESMALNTEQLFPLGPCWENMDGGLLDQGLRKLRFYQETFFFRAPRTV